MTDKARGSDQLKLNCATFSALTQEEVMQVAGGFLINYEIVPFPRGLLAWWKLAQEPSLPSFDIGGYSKPGF